MKFRKKTRLIVLLITTIILICGTGITYSLFTSSATLVTNQKIATFVFNTQKTDVIELPITNLNPGDKTNYTFKVTNTLDNKKSEVTINYSMTIKTYHFMPLEIVMYKIENEQDKMIIKCDETYSRNKENQLLCNTPVQIMKHSQSVQDNYKLEIIFPEEYNSEVYSELVDYIDIEINSWQTTGEQVNYEK